MSTSYGGANRQRELFPRSKRPTIPIDPKHRLVQVTDTLDRTTLAQRAQKIRALKLKNGAGRPPHLRALLGTLVLMAPRRMTYRETDDQIRYYAPARYLCGLTETEWTPDFTTIQDFTQLLGEDGIKLINEYTVGLAVEEKLADPKVIVADTTAQEAAVPHPNEMGLMAGFLTSVAAAGKKVRGALGTFLDKTAAQLQAAKQKVRAYRLFAKTEAAKDRVMKQLVNIVEKVNQHLAAALQTAARQPTKLR